MYIVSPLLIIVKAEKPSANDVMQMAAAKTELAIRFMMFFIITFLPFFRIMFHYHTCRKKTLRRFFDTIMFIHTHSRFLLSIILFHLSKKEKKSQRTVSLFGDLFSFFAIKKDYKF